MRYVIEKDGKFVKQPNWLGDFRFSELGVLQFTDSIWDAIFIDPNGDEYERARYVCKELGCKLAPVVIQLCSA